MDVILLIIIGHNSIMIHFSLMTTKQFNIIILFYKAGVFFRLGQKGSFGSFNGALILTCNFREGGGSIFNAYNPPPRFRC